jgi:predicted nucleic acid-binding protein
VKALLVDSSVVLDIFTRDPSFYRKSLIALIAWGTTHETVVNDIVYTEVSVGFQRIETLEEALAGAGFGLRPIPKAALFLAGKAFASYRQRGGTRTSVLPDFIIGAHAAVEGLPLLTRDAKRVREAYPSVEIVGV